MGYRRQEKKTGRVLGYHNQVLGFCCSHKPRGPHRPGHGPGDARPWQKNRGPAEAFLRRRRKLETKIGRGGFGWSPVLRESASSLFGPPPKSGELRSAGGPGTTSILRVL